MTGINTRVEFLKPPSDHMRERGHVSLLEKARQRQHSSHLALNSSVGNGSLPLFTPATQHLQGSFGPEAPLETCFFQCASRANVNSLRETTDTCTSAFQGANRREDVSFDNIHLQSDQNHLATSHVFSSFDSLHKASLIEKQKRKDNCKDVNNPSVSDSASAHPVAKRVPIFKTARSKASSVPLLHDNKAKKRLNASSKEESVKKHAGISSFNHSEISAFKPVATNGTSETASVPSPSLSTENSDHQNISSGSQSKTLPRKPKFGKSRPCLNKKIKEERHPLVTVPGNREKNREGSDAILSSQPGEGSESVDKPQTEVFSHSSSPLLKEELNVGRDNPDITGTFGKEYESGVEDSLTLTPVQCTLPDRKMNKTQDKKKNLPNIRGSKESKFHETKINKKKHPESSQGRKKQQSQRIVAGKKSQSEVGKDIDKTPSQVINGRKSNESQTFRFSKTTSCTQMIPDKKKKNPSSDGRKSTLSDALKAKKKLKPMKNCTSTSAANQQTTKADLPGQMEKDTHCFYTDDPSHRTSVSEDLTESALRSSPLSHDTAESSLDSSYSRTSELSSCVGRERSLERDRYEESNRITDEEITNHSEAVKESVLELLNSLDRDMWVQCDRCLKWRKLTHILDPATLPDKWYCTMLPVPGKNSCREPEEEWNADESYIYYEHQFVVGSVVWAQVPGSPWWPAMVDIDPDYKRYDWFNNAGTNATSYHVTFFGDPVMRAWVTCSNIRIFKQNDCYKKFILDRKKDPSRDNLLRKAVQEATHALSMEVQLRRRTYTFVARYTGRIGRSSPVHNQSETSKVKAAPLKTFGHRKQKKEFKGFPTAAPPLGMKPISVEPADAVEKNNVGNIRPQSLQDDEINKHTDTSKYETRLQRQEQDRSEGFDKQNLNESNSDNDQYQMYAKENEEDARVSGRFLDIMNANSTETSGMEFCNTECSTIDEYEETSKEVATNGNPNSILKCNRYVLSKMARKENIAESYTGIEETIEKMKIISNENVASSEKHLSSNEVYETDIQENEETIDSVDGSDLQDNEDTGSNYQEQDDSEVNYKQSDTESEQYDTASNSEHNDIEKYSFEGDTSEFVEQGDQDDNEYDEQVNTESNYEQDTSAYEGQDNEDNCEDNEYTFRQNSEYNDGQNNEDSCEALSHCDYEDDDSEQNTGCTNEGEGVDDKDAVQNFYEDNENSYEHQSECDYEERDLNDYDENEHNYEEQQIDDDKKNFWVYDEHDNESEYKKCNGNNEDDN